LQHIRQLVHSYTLLSDEERWSSTEATTIAELTGYVIGPPVTEAMHEGGAYNTAVSMASRIKAFSQIEPQLQKTEELRLEEVKKVQDITECITEKVKGKFRYFHSVTGQQLSANAYEQRYRLMLDEICAIRSEEWAHYFADLEHNERSILASPLPDIQQREEAYLQSKSPHTKQTGTTVPDTPLSKNNLYNTVLSSPLRPPDEDLLEDALVCPMRPLNEDVISDTSSGSSSSNIDDDEDEDADTHMLMALPSRDEVNEDPDLARAEHKLWSTIDQALAEYSAEVIAIRERKERGGVKNDV
jgi:hypothetical protein